MRCAGAQRALSEDMRTCRLGVLLTILGACDGGGTSDVPDPDPAAPDAGTGSMPGTPPDGGTATPDGGTTTPPDDGCASPPTGDWAGSTKDFARGSGPSQSHGGDVTWTLVSTEGCVDRYAPSGTAWVDNEGYVCEANYESSTSIAATDGALTIDRTTSPPTYTMTGTTRWQVTTGCPDTEPFTVTSTWASYRGVIDGDVFGGGHRQALDVYWQWRFTRLDADLPPPDGCSEPAEDTWTGAHTATGPGTDDLVATVTWTRTSTEGCVDRFQPSGTATLAINPQAGCTSGWAEPGEGAVEPGDGLLEIDRSTNPPTFTTQASVGWPAIIYCMDADGNTTSYSSNVSNRWDEYGPLDGDVVAGALVLELTEHTWRLER